MAKINRFNGDVKAFGSNSQSGEFYTFGSTVDTSKDFDNLLNSDFLRGWGIVGPSDVPPLEWFNAIGFTATQFASYLHQMGVAEWNSLQEYPSEGGLVVHNGKVWRRGSSWSLGDEPDVSSSWVLLLDSESIGSVAYVENRFKGNQNWNVAGSSGDPLPDGTPRTYTVGSEIVAGVEVITNDAEQITYVSGVLNSGNNTGIIRRRYKKDAAGLITKSSQYGGIKISDNSQVQALVDDIVTNGVRIAEDGSDVVIDVDLSVVTSGFRFFGMSENTGVWESINDEESYSSQTKMNLVNRTPVSTADSYETDESGRVTYYITREITTTSAGVWSSVSVALPFTMPNGVLSKEISLDSPVSNQALNVAIDSTTSVAILYLRSDSPITQSVTAKIEGY